VKGGTRRSERASELAGWRANTKIIQSRKIEMEQSFIGITVLTEEEKMQNRKIAEESKP
jgi:hypothetical protein